MNNFKNGFTLITLICVISIIAILSTIIVPISSGYIKSAKNTQINENARILSNAVKVAIALDPSIVVEEYEWIDDPKDHVNWGYFSYKTSYVVGNMPNGSWGFVNPDDISDYLPNNFPIAHGGKNQKIGEYSAHIMVNKNYPSKNGVPVRYVNGSLISDDLPPGTVIEGGSVSVVVDYLADDGVLYTIMNPKTPNTFWPFSEKHWLEDR